jgi:hypothetical protein
MVTSAANLLAKAKQIKEESAALQEYCHAVLPEQFNPSLTQCRTWISLYGGLDNAIAGIDRTGIWLSQIEAKNEKRKAEGKQQLVKGYDEVLKYASAVMRNLRDGIDPGQKNGDEQ